MAQLSPFKTNKDAFKNSNKNLIVSWHFPTINLIITKTFIKRAAVSKKVIKKAHLKLLLISFIQFICYKSISSSMPFNKKMLYYYMPILKSLSLSSLLKLNKIII